MTYIPATWEDYNNGCPLKIIQGATNSDVFTLTQSVGTTGLVDRGTYSGVTAYIVGDIVLYNGTTYACILASTGNLPTNATYWALCKQINLSNLTGSILFYSTQDNSTPFLSLTTENGGLSFGGVLGTVTRLITATQSASFAHQSGTWIFKLVNGSNVDRLITGKFVLDFEGV